MVAGDPVRQVQAPAIFNRIFQRHGVDAVLVPAQVPAAHFSTFARAVLGADNIQALWLTIPHKTTLVDELGRMDTAARVAGAVNAVRRGADGQLEGALFDGEGLVSALHHWQLAPTGQRVLLVGAGGAGAAIAVALVAAGVSELRVRDADPGRAARLLQRLQAHAWPASGTGPRLTVWDGHAPLNDVDLVIHATPLGLHADDPLPLEVADLRPGAAVVDILMKPQATPLMRACAERGLTVHPGFEMLVQQVPDYLRFVGLPELAGTLAQDLSEVRRHLMTAPPG
ncbi:shikimate dehydrogenase [Ideonella sp. TBM-1]|uniref:Shikimate dehydrogenase n=2 Tax=Ideonella livida TaxID=2707176 RepID=A0A7C9PK45_9BURK|nr:shikimate dehydrogenase [Ideonella livida]